MDYKKFYDLDNYIFEDIRCKFEKNGYLGALDFFCIVILKANRAKSKIAQKLLEKGADIESIIKEMTRKIYEAKENKEKLYIILEDYKLSLPMGSAILTVLYPEKFTVYDIRVCDMLQNYKDLINKTKFESKWIGYEKYKNSVIKKVPNESCLREKDKYLWGKSFYQQLKNDIKENFSSRLE